MLCKPFLNKTQRIFEVKLKNNSPKLVWPVTFCKYSTLFCCPLSILLSDIKLACFCFFCWFCSMHSLPCLWTGHTPFCSPVRVPANTQIRVHLTLFHLGFKDKWEDFTSSWKLSVKMPLSVKSQGFTRCRDPPVQQATINFLLSSFSSPSVSSCWFSWEEQPDTTKTDSCRKWKQLTLMRSYSLAWFRKEGCILIRMDLGTLQMHAEYEGKEMQHDMLVLLIFSVPVQQKQQENDKKVDLTPF